MEWTHKYMGIPFASHGSDFEGCDCGGLAYLIYKTELGIEHPYMKTYSHGDDSQNKAIQEQIDSWEKVDTPEKLDIISLRVGVLLHLGIYIGSNRMLHCIEGSGTCIESLTSLKWKNRIMGFYRYG